MSSSLLESSRAVLLGGAVVEESLVDGVGELAAQGADASAVGGMTASRVTVGSTP
jgi:hypothetical protein